MAQANLVESYNMAGCRFFRTLLCNRDIRIHKREGMDKDPNHHYHVNLIYECIYYLQRGDLRTHTCEEPSAGLICQCTMVPVSRFSDLENVEKGTSVYEGVIERISE